MYFIVNRVFGVAEFVLKAISTLTPTDNDPQVADSYKLGT